MRFIISIIRYTLTCFTHIQSQNENEGKDHPELLPSGWVLNMRTQNGGKCNGKQIKVFDLDFMNGYIIE